MLATRSMLRRCLAMIAGAVAGSALLLAAGVPGAVLLAVAPVLVCVALHVLMGHADPHGEELLRTARRAAADQAAPAIGRAAQDSTSPGV
jgi:hypothetical protein